MKETFIVRTEWKEAIFELSEIQQSIIFKNLFHYHSDFYNLIDITDISVKLVWKLIEPNLKRNINSYDKRCETSKLNGSLGGRPKDKHKTKPNKPNKPIVTLSDSDSDSDSVSENENEKIFNEFRKKFPGTKRGNKTEFDNFKKKHSDWKIALNELSAKLNEQVAWRIKAKQSESFIPEWANLQTWINQRRWESEMPKIESNAMKI